MLRVELKSSNNFIFKNNKYNNATQNFKIDKALLNFNRKLEYISSFSNMLKFPTAQLVKINTTFSDCDLSVYLNNEIFKNLNKK